jgi:predicted dienelactone hydrolase
MSKMRALLCLCLGLAAVSCSSGESEANGPPLIDLQGAAGATLESTRYSVPGTGDVRDLPLTIWYPTADESGTITRFNIFQRDELSYLNASVDIRGGRAPLLIYSHGDRAWGGSAHRIARQFAQNGWVVVASLAM